MTFIEILLLILALALSIIAVRISFKFDINKYLENRRKIKINQLKNICPHGRLSPHEGNAFLYESYFSSPSGTFQWGCSQCGLVVNSKSEVDRISEYLSKYPDQFIKRQKKYFKKSKKLNLH